MLTPAPGPEEHEARVRASWPFVGREAEFAAVTGALEGRVSDGEANPGSARGAVLVASPGVGKTRLLAEVRAWAARRGLRTAQVIATEAASHTPYGAVLHLLPEGTTDPMDRATWHAGFARALRADGTPTLLIVDDAHHLDLGSAALILQLALEGAARPLVAVRRGDRLPDSITALWRNGLAVRVDLRPFSVPQMQHLISAALGGTVSGRTLARLAAVCDGNVLLARELVAGAVGAGSLQPQEGVWTWDDRVVLAPRLIEAVGARLAELPAAQREALAVVALGEPLPAHLAEHLVGHEALQTLEAQDLIRLEGADLSAVLRLAHPLHGEVVLSELGRLTRRRLLIRLADALDADPHPGGEHVFRAVGWRLEAGAPQAPEHLLRAAASANRAFDQQLAERLARAGLQALGPGPTASPAGSTPGACTTELALTVELALAQVRSNRHAEAHTLLVGIEDRVVTSGDRELQDHYLDARFWACALGLGHLAEASRVLDRYAAPPPGAGRREPGLDAYRANLALAEGSPRRALALTEPLLVEGVEGVTALQRLLALETCSEALVSLGLHRRAAVVWDQLRAASAGSGRALSAGAEADLQALWAAQLDGRYAELLPQVEAFHAAMDRSPDVVTRGLASLALGRILLMTGALHRARAVLLDAVADFRQVDLGGTLGWALALLSTTAALTGALQDARRWHDEAQRPLEPGGRPRQRIDLVAAQVWLAVAEGDSSAARARALQGAAELPELELARAWHLHLAVRVGERGAATAAALAEIADRAECTLPALLADHVEALRAANGRRLEEVADRFHERGLTVLAAEAASQAVSAHRAAGSVDGARRASVRAAGLTAQFDAFTTPALGGADPETVTPLSRRELDVARLAAAGLSNAAIAQRLVVSVRTVESHLYQVFAKLGVQRRTELAALLPTATPSETGRSRGEHQGITGEKSVVDH